MKKSYVLGLMCFVVGSVGFVQAQALDESPYEQQLRPYSEFHSDYVETMKAENEKKRAATEGLRVTDMQLREEYGNLQTDIEMKEDSIGKLKGLNEKLQTAQSVMQEQYLEMEKLFGEQKVENERLKTELETSKTAFHSKMLEFYAQEDQMVTDQIAALQERQKYIRDKMQMIKDQLDVE